MDDIALGVNVDHVATLRQARGTRYPDPVDAALLAERSGADAITVHLREDRRHIQDRDVELMARMLQTRMNLEMAVSEEMIGIAVRTAPFACCLVPEKREELTTEGGLDVVSNGSKIKEASAELAAAGVRVSLFIDPVAEQIEAAARAGAPVIELHTGRYADAKSPKDEVRELRALQDAAHYGAQLGLIVHGGHGLHFHNVQPVAAISEIVELNIGHAIVSRAVIDGMANAVAAMKALMRAARFQ